MVVKALIRFSVAALVLVCIGISGCSEGSDRIYTPTANDSNDQLALGLEPDYAIDGNPGDGDGYPIFGDDSEDDQDEYDGWINKEYPEADGGVTGGSTKPLDFQHYEN